MALVLLPTAYLRRKYIITGMLKRRKCACAGLSALPFLFVAIMAVADDIQQFLTRANLLLNSVHRKIQDDPEENFRDQFQLEKSAGERLWLLEGSVHGPIYIGLWLCQCS